MREPVIEAHRLSKSYATVHALRDLSFSVYPGEIFGLLGPNGAGKTTAIRLLMGFYVPDRGEVRIWGHPPDRVRHRIGYLPEERGLYPDLPVLETLLYLAALHGVPHWEARKRAEAWLARLELADRARSKVRDLSKGMQQKVQLIVTLIHDPALLILDEPFQGLDPVNTELFKHLIVELRNQGKTILLSAHQMNLIEELCDRILLIHRGEGVLYGRVDEIRARYGSHRVRLRTTEALGELRDVKIIERSGDTYLLELTTGSPSSLLQELVRRGIQIDGFEIERISLHEIFVSIVQRDRAIRR